MKVKNFIQPDFAKLGGLLPVIVQEWDSHRRGKVLMLAYANEEALQLTLETGYAHFLSRSRKSLWKKGETSGNLLLVKQILLDCDQDTLLYLVVSSGIVCHLGRSDCFFELTSGSVPMETGRSTNSSS
jgi:phosphoribosyl-AMP cyclohydrolase